MAKQENSQFDKTNKSVDKNNDSVKQPGANDSAASPAKNLDTESEFAVNELREEKRDSE